MRAAIIFDIDGTLADHSHRRHFVEKRPKDFKSFREAEHLDEPHAAILELLDILGRQYTILLCSGRVESSRAVTEQWLSKHDVPHARLFMRQDGDFRPDYVIKEEMLNDIISQEYEPWLVIDDRSSVVKMWRSRGLTCLQCAEGDF